MKKKSTDVFRQTFFALRARVWPQCKSTPRSMREPPYESRVCSASHRVFANPKNFLIFVATLD